MQQVLFNCFLLFERSGASYRRVRLKNQCPFSITIYNLQNLKLIVCAFFFLQKVLSDVTTKFWCVGFCLFVCLFFLLRTRASESNLSQTIIVLSIKLRWSCFGSSVLWMPRQLIHRRLMGKWQWRITVREQGTWVISYYSCCFDQIPGKSNLRKESLYWFSIWGFSLSPRKSWWQGFEKASGHNDSAKCA